MSNSSIIKSGPLSGASRQQYGVLPYRKGKELELLLITSRETRRWIIPKGWPMKGLKPHDAAAVEAYEEAGITGKVSKRGIGSYVYWKAMRDQTFLPIEVLVYPFKVKEMMADWPEREERDLAWFAPRDAIVAVVEPGLKELIAHFAGLIRSGVKRP